MDKNQKINCTVESCKYNDEQAHECALDQITVEPCDDCHTGIPEDESACGSYEEDEDAENEEDETEDIETNEE